MTDLNQLCLALRQLQAAGARVYVGAYVTEEELASLATLTNAPITAKWEESYDGKPSIKLEITSKVDGVSVSAYAERKPTAEDWHKRMQEAQDAGGIRIVK